MKAIIFFILFTLLAIPTAFAQIKIGDNPQNIDASSVLELESTSKVLVITRVTTLEMEAITPQRGGMVYNTDTECINYFDGTQWVNLCDAVNFSITNDPIINGRSTIEITETAGSINLEVAKNSILGDNIIDGGIGPDDIQDNSITQEKLAAESVGSSELRQNSVGSEEIRDASIAPADIANFTPGQVLTTDENGIVQWEDSDGLFDLTFNKLDTTLTIAKSTIAGVSTISLGALIGSDDQQLDLTNNILSIENGENTLDLSTYLQELSINAATNEITLSNGNTITLPAAAVEVDGIVGNEILNATDGTLVRFGGGTDTNPYTLDVNAGGIDTEELANNAVTNIKLADNSVRTANILNGTISTLDIAPAAAAPANTQILTTSTAGVVGWVDIPAGTVDTDEQQLSIAGNRISLTDGGFVDIPEGNLSLDDGFIFVGNAASEPTPVAVGGDVTMNNIGEFAIEDEAVTPIKIEPAPGVLTEDQVLITTIAGDVEWANFPPGGGGGTDQDASEVDYDNTTSGLTATTTQAAIDELAGSGLVDTDEQDASEVPYDGTASGLTATTTQAALDELAGITEIDGIIGNEVTAATDATLELSGTGTSADPLTLDVAALGIDTDELAAGAVTLPKLADGTAAGQLLQWDGTEWVYIQEADITATVTEIDGIVGNEVSAVADATLELTGTGTNADPLTLDVSALGIDTAELAAGAVTLPKMADGTTAGQLLQWDGTEWVYITEADIAVTEIDGIIGNEVSAVADATLELTGTGTNADPLTLDVSALGIDTAELAAGAVTLPKMADGTATGQLLQWDGTEWVYILEADITATITEIDGIIGNEITDVTATNTTLTRSGTGTNVDPYTIAVAENGITNNEIIDDAVTLAKLANGTTAGQLLQWDGTDWVYVSEADISGHSGTVEGSIFFAAPTTFEPTENNAHLYWDNTNNRLSIGEVTRPLVNKLSIDGSTRTSGLLNSDGTSGTPSYRFSDDLNTGFYSPYQDQIGLSTDGTEALRIGFNQNVGIGNFTPTGNTNPNSTLEVKGSLSTNIRNDDTNLVTISDNDYTIIIEPGASTVELPAAAADNKGRVYVLKNITGTPINIDSYVNADGSNLAQTTLPMGILKLQSDGALWHQIN
ncbi:hypothetical protein SAMN04488007_3822 [Maribacter aquivivus]|uniref:Uncharacterized protein n=1 Tax=Maribacter aquivivus TaxID=228958 RepID=A0A1M6VAU0_9FLAO|nr:hypothetical protein [Maribacter aquivivus]SHK78613.1 hypothetical protein SAMN04488007_3822 [Maribacter aquivivus]